jgi:uncharacterized NAD(P)/FAD-binding protein YdhS
VALTIQLLLRSPSPLSITVVNRDGLPGRGVAYGTLYDSHILNVTASKMSVILDDPEHFLRWLRISGYDARDPHFAPRRLYGEYVEDTLNQIVKSKPRSAVYWIQGCATSLTIEAGKPNLKLDSGQSVQADIAVLATGNSPPVSPPQLHTISGRFYAPYAWADDALSGIPQTGTVLILGSGLTAVDQVLALGEQNFQGTIFMLSRHGRMPSVHSDSVPWTANWTSSLQGTLRTIVTSVRQQVDLATSKGMDWQSVIDSLRPVSSQLWRNISMSDRKQFLRHVRTHWEVLRHRIPQKTQDTLAALMQNGRLQVLAGRLLGAAEQQHHVNVTLCERECQKPHILAVHRIINCTGLEATTRSQDPLIHDLIAQGLARTDPLELGIDINQCGSLINAYGQPSSCLYTLGPVRKASDWETTAVPEIRMQAAQLAEIILQPKTKQSQDCLELSI